MSPAEEALYVLYESWTHRRARIHQDGCRHINWHRVMEGVEWDYNRWIDLGVFENVKDAVESARFMVKHQHKCFGCCQVWLHGSHPPPRKWIASPRIAVHFFQLGQQLPMVCALLRLDVVGNLLKLRHFSG